MKLFLSLRNKLVFACLLLSFYFAQPISAQNAIVTENTLAGSNPTIWDVDGAGDLSIQGFATDISVNKGETVHFKIKTNASAYTIRIYRIGYYQGKGACFKGKATITAALPQTQLEALYDASTGLTDCGNWTESAHWDVPADAVSGIYIAKLIRTDNGGASHIVFIVRNDASTSDLFFQTSDGTWQAYNVYGGNSLYVGSTDYPAGHAAKVSYNRPFVTRNGGGGGGAAEDWLFNSEYPMIRFLERNGYDVSYTTDVDAARRGSLMLNHKVYMSVGHDEYWSAEQRANVEAARNAGVHLAFFSGNEIYWKTRYEPSTDGSNTPYRTLVCYKEGTLGEVACGTKCDPTNIWTGLWRDGCSYPSSDGCKPENALSGQISWDGTTGAIEVPDTYKNLRFWRNTSIANLGSGQTATLLDGTLGYEWDWEQYPAYYPAGRIRMSSTTLDGRTHHLSLYRHSSGAMVFSAGTVQWTWGLDGKHDRGSAPADIRMQQATINLLADMGAQPATRQSNLVAATASTDHQAPSSVITNPTNGTSVPSGSAITITGTASDVGGGVVAGIEVSVDGGTTWQVANGTSNWTYTWTPSNQGTVTIKSRAVDDNVNLEIPGSSPAPNAIKVNVAASQATCPCTIFQPTDVPDIAAANDNTGGIENGVKFKATQDGFITGIRFYKGSGNTGTHTGQLWSVTGTLLAQATFSNESTSGWQEVMFDSPVPITAGTVYVAANHSSAGYYAYSDEYFTVEKVNGPLHALANSDPDGPNGVYLYTANPAFPTKDFQSSNYWVDVVFAKTAAPDHIPPTVTSTMPINNAQTVNVNSTITTFFNEAINPSTINNTTVKLKTSSTNKTITATVSYNSGSYSAILIPSSQLLYSTSYTVTIKGGTTGQRIKDISGNSLAASYTWTFTTSAPPPPAPAEGPNGPVLLISSSSNPFSRYPVEILRAQGFNEFKAIDISEVTAKLLNKYDVVIVGNIALSAGKVTLLTNWTNAGGTLIAFRPDARLSTLLGLSAVTGNLSDKYILVNTATAPGTGIVNQTMQYHGTADLYTLNSGATSIATLYSDANTPTSYPAVTTRNVGSNGGKAIAFTYDLARSIVYTRQGNPAWAGQKRDGQIDPIRSDDQFFPDYVDFNKIAIPQADEQMQLLTNIILLNNLHKKPLPRFWFLPRGLQAAVVMTGDDHGNGGTVGRFNKYEQSGPNDPQSVTNWTAIRGTSYIYPGTPITNAQATAFQSEGFEIALHTSTNCQNFTPASLEDDYATQLPQLAEQLPGINPPVTNRTHCITWSDWASEPKTEAAHGIRLDANYYYWPESWVHDRPGMFTGSGMPMRFADLDGSLIDCYQVVTQMTDESGITYSNFINQLLDKALGTEGYYGVFCANMHTDNASSDGSDAIVASAQAHKVPVISAKQMLDWLDGRNGSSFGSVTWNGNALSFSIAVGNGGNNLKAMLPTTAATGQLQSISLNGSSIPDTIQTIKGIEYAFFNAAAGNYVAIYGSGFTQSIAKTSSVQQDLTGKSKNDDLYLKASPNPSTNEFTLTVESKILTPYEIRVIDLSGKNVFQEKSSGNKTFRFGKNFSSGTYILGPAG